MGAAPGDGLGRVFNVIHEASGLDVPLTTAHAVSFVSFLAAGTQTLTFTQTDSTGVNSEIDLKIFLNDDNRDSRAYVGPGVGGTWTAKTEASDNTIVAGGATNDAIVVTVRAEQLTDGYDRVQCTTDGGTCIAIMHDLSVQRKPENLKSSLTA